MIIWWVYEKMEHVSCAGIIAMSLCACLPETISGTRRRCLHYAEDIKQGVASCGLILSGIFLLFIFHLSVWSCSYLCWLKKTRYAMQQCRNSNMILQLIFPQFCFLIDENSHYSYNTKNDSVPALLTISFVLFSECFISLLSVIAFDGFMNHQSTTQCNLQLH